jgi:molybdopterin-dependent oxidoreductase-like protein
LIQVKGEHADPNYCKLPLGTPHGLIGKDLGITGARKPGEVLWREEAPEGKLDLLVTLDFRMSTTCVYSDIVLPTATWYEKNDLNTSDMHPFIHPLTGAVDPVCEARSDWEIYKAIARKFSELAPEVLGVERDVVLTPLLHDTPAEMAQALDVKDWARGECEPVPGKTTPAVTVVERDYPNLYRRLTSLGPLMSKLGNGGKGRRSRSADAGVREGPAGTEAGRNRQHAGRDPLRSPYHPSRPTYPRQGPSLRSGARQDRRVSGRADAAHGHRPIPRTRGVTGRRERHRFAERFGFAGILREDAHLPVGLRCQGRVLTPSRTRRPTGPTGVGVGLTRFLFNL